jgi:uncharacterized protein GlcG (DUF336 family)
VSATVVGRNGEIIVQVRGDNTGPHTIENSMRKAYTARTFRSPSGALVERLKADPTLGLIHLTNVIANQGALPIKVGDEVIGAAGASGAPGGEKDEACVKAGIDKVADQLPPLFFQLGEPHGGKNASNYSSFQGRHRNSGLFGQ